MSFPSSDDPWLAAPDWGRNKLSRFAPDTAHEAPAHPAKLMRESLDPVPPPPTGKADGPCDPRIAGWLYGPVEGQPACLSFAILEPSHVPGLAEIVVGSGLPHLCLYRDDADGSTPLAKLAPWLVQLDPDVRLSRNLITHDPQAPHHWHLWHARAALFLRSALSLNRLAEQLRRWNMILDENGRRQFLRYWDSAIFEDFVEAHQAGGSLALFQGVAAYVVYDPDTALRLSLDGPASPGPIRITQDGRDRYTRLRRARLERVITAHFAQLPEFAAMPQDDLRQHVRVSAQMARAAGLGEPEEIFRFALGLGLPGDNAPVHAALAQLDGAEPAARDELRRSVMNHLEPRITAARDAAATRQDMRR